jgi:hypothetical protein
VMWLQNTGISECTHPTRDVSNHMWDLKRSRGNAVGIATGCERRMEANPTCTRHFHFTFYCKELFSYSVTPLLTLANFL